MFQSQLFLCVGQAIAQTMADVVVHPLSSAVDIAGAPLHDMVDAEAGNLQATLYPYFRMLYFDALYLEKYTTFDSSWLT